MNFIDDLNYSSVDTETLSEYLNENVDLAYDYFISQSYSEIKSDKKEIDQYIFQNLNVIKKLDLSERSNSTFILCLLEVSERLGFTLYFQRLYKLLLTADIQISLRLQAAKMYFSGMRNIADFEKVLYLILEKLEKAFIIEEDGVDKVILTVTKLYTTIIDSFGDYNAEGVLKFKNQLKEAKNDFFFLRNETISHILAVDLTNSNSASGEIHKILDEFLKREKFVYPISKGDFLIESGTEYSKNITSGLLSFATIRNVSSKSYRSIKQDSIFNSLGRGVEVLTSEEQLLAYMYGYGKMHFAKINEGFKKLPKDILDQSLDIIDWGCGQALASHSFLDYYSSDTPSQNIMSFHLIEPSEIALRRGALHLKSFDNKLNLITINKDLDSLKRANFRIKEERIKLHLFSNILDIDAFSLTNLISLVKTTFKGENYFVIASPFITDIKTDRIDRFVSSFEDKISFDLLANVDKYRGEWLNGWTMVLRVFKVNL
ncbi:MAG: hypothetical protein R3353_01085 [Salegentibacter mishustinae]|nr:hypothetical protein [Salegentibacter mishustinae]